jgi:hypothetical protein
MTGLYLQTTRLALDGAGIPLPCNESIGSAFSEEEGYWLPVFIRNKRNVVAFENIVNPRRGFKGLAQLFV